MNLDLCLICLRRVGKNNYEIDYNELEMEKEIGRGAYGVVFKGSWRGGKVAISKFTAII
jgi:predicted Ser/Thr protein kinase